MSPLRASKKKVSEKVIRLNEFRAKAGHTEELHDFLISFAPLIRSFEGCESYRILQNTENPDLFVVEEIWTSQEVHQACAREIPAEIISRMTQLLRQPLAGAYYRSIGA